MVLLLLHGCALRSDRLRWQVASPDRVALQLVTLKNDFWGSDYDLAHPVEVLPADGAERSVAVPNRPSVVARRNADASIDLLTTDKTLNVVAADGTVTVLSEDHHQLPTAGYSAAFVVPPTHFAGRAPLRLRLITPRDNVLDARILVRRDPAGGGLVGFGALVAGLGSAAIGVSVPNERAHGSGGEFGVSIGAVALSAAALAIGLGLHALLLREHDRHLSR